MSQEYFWGCELNKDKREYVWDPNAEFVEYDEIGIKHSLLIKQALIGIADSVVEGEVNIVEVETEGYMDVSLKQPIIRLQNGLVDQCSLDTFIPKKATLRLTTGTGPVFIHGQHLIECDEEEEESTGGEEDLVEECEEEEDGGDKKSPSPEKNRKRKAECSVIKSKPKKMARLDPNVGLSEEENEVPDGGRDSKKKLQTKAKPKTNGYKSRK